MNRKDHKHQLELLQISALLKELGVSQEACSCEDRPDIRLTLLNGKQVGIEVTQYGDGGINKASSACCKILKEYADRIDKNSTKQYCAVVSPCGQFLHSDIRYQKKKNEIFKEIDLFRLGQASTPSTLRYIEYAHFEEMTSIKNSSVGIMEVIEYGDINSQQLLDRIKKKSDKLNDYKKEDKNKDITEYWLAIYVDSDERVDILSPLSITNLISDYDRIYLCDLFYCKRIR